MGGRFQKYSSSLHKGSRSCLTLYHRGLWNILSITVLIFSISTFYPEQSHLEIVHFLGKQIDCISSVVEHYIIEKKCHQGRYHPNNQDDHKIHSFARSPNSQGHKSFFL